MSLEKAAATGSKIEDFIFPLGSFKSPRFSEQGNCNLILDITAIQSWESALARRNTLPPE
jgi:hypothetical protein